MDAPPNPGSGVSGVRRPGSGEAHDGSQFESIAKVGPLCRAQHNFARGRASTHVQANVGEVVRSLEKCLPESSPDLRWSVLNSPPTPSFEDYCIRGGIRFAAGDGDDVNDGARVREGRPRALRERRPPRRGARIAQDGSVDLRSGPKRRVTLASPLPGTMLAAIAVSIRRLSQKSDLSSQIDSISGALPVEYNQVLPPGRLGPELAQPRRHLAPAETPVMNSLCI